MRRSNQPFFWLLFGAGGMLAALAGAMLAFITGVAVPLALGLPAGLMGYDNALAFARGAPGKLALFLVVSLFLWHAAHRIYHSLHDFGVKAGTGPWLACYGLAFAGTAFAALCLLALGF